MKKVWRVDRLVKPEEYRDMLVFGWDNEDIVL